MPSTTPLGLPFPLSTEPVRDGALAVQALAQALDTRGWGYHAQFGRVDPNVTGGNYVFTYPKPFIAPPVLFLCQADVLAGPLYPRVGVNNDQGGVQSATASLFVVNGVTDTAWTGLCILRWLAIGRM